MIQLAAVRKRSSLLLLAPMLILSATVFLSGCKNNKSNTKSAESASGAHAPAAGRCAKATRTLFDPLVKDAPSCETLLTDYPEADTAPSDDKIICPFLRILRSSGFLTSEINSNSTTPAIAEKGLIQPVRVSKLVEAATTFGCGAACQAVATNVSKGQGFDKINGDSYVDIGALYSAKAVAHNCGFNFAFGDHQANDSVRDASLQLLKTAADANNGRVTLAVLQDVKNQMCARDFAIWNRNPSQPHVNELDKATNPTKFDTGSSDQIEVGLIFTLLGGIDQDQSVVASNQSIAYSDVDLLFHGKLPKNKTIFTVDAPLFLHINHGAFIFDVVMKTIEEKLAK